MTAQVIEYPGATTLDLDPDRVLEGAKAVDFDDVLVIGLDADSKLYMAGSTGDIGHMLLIVEMAKARIMRIASGELDGGLE